MGYKLTAIWSRKPDLEFQTIQLQMQAKSIVENHNIGPTTILADKDLLAEYTALFGADEASELQKGNMVASWYKDFVKGGVWVPAEPKPATQSPAAGSIVVQTPFGSIVRPPNPTSAPDPNTLIGNLTLSQFASVMESIIKANL